MSHPVRNLLATLLIALHAAIAIGGPGLHAGPGLSHAGRPASADQSGGSEDLAPVQVTASPVEHCPLCDYFAQGQLPFPLHAPALALVATPFEPTRTRVEAPHPPVIATRSRAPPVSPA